jgi:hypothetical protein
MRGYTAGKAYGLRPNRDIKHFVSLWDQPPFNLLVALMYHRIWEKISWRGFRIVEPLHQAIFEKDDDFYIPLTNRQDLRCDDLQHKGRKTLALIYITEEQYNKITKR